MVIFGSKILLRNLNFPNMCNGRNLLIKGLQDNMIMITIFTVFLVEQLKYISLIFMIQTNLSISFKILQFPMKISFYFTIRRSNIYSDKH
jgi:hypothetical protein